MIIQQLLQFREIQLCGMQELGRLQGGGEMSWAVESGIR